MDDNDEWDLQAVVRSCNTISANSTNTTITIDEYDDEFDVMGSVPCSNATNPFSYWTCSENASEGLEEVYKEGCSQQCLTVAAATTTAQLSVGDEPLHEMLNACDSTSTSRKRKNQQKKMVVQLTQEELCSDTWAWRKYGQKPIKGSPFPRNYYKCSTTKACGARKQVEQSHMDPTIFIVSYSGEHIHPPPTHRSPLAGSTRSTKFAMPNIPTISEDATQSRTLGGDGCCSDDNGREI
ncbi:putative transcription factor WRKY family [Helianthus annuus]|uniref:Transcription factor WRKY family n=1 Tax=Helianthus annuus TaxID=4232 RepID=A0A9K3HBF4_HELAN|nr:probable WRKY transcription factor 27 [Helianthus annuus]KAF5772299.1 putative transcription factor WRKY family [Helianthus annuus]